MYDESEKILKKFHYTNPITKSYKLLVLGNGVEPPKYIKCRNSKKPSWYIYIYIYIYIYWLIDCGGISLSYFSCFERTAIIVSDISFGDLSEYMIKKTPMSRKAHRVAINKIHLKSFFQFR